MALLFGHYRMLQWEEDCYAITPGPQWVGILQCMLADLHLHTIFDAGQSGNCHAAFFLKQLGFRAPVHQKMKKKKKKKSSYAG